MIKGALTNTTSGRPAILVGLSAENTKRLMEGKPILMQLREAIARLPDKERGWLEDEGLGCDLLIVGGETEESIQRDLVSVVQEHNE